MTKKELNKIKELLEMDMKPEDITYLVKASYGEILKVANKKKMDTKRKIKFRAWDKEKKEMVDWDELQNVEVKYVFNDDSRNVLMQYTGLKDKNDKEIYESDILKDSFGLIAKVIWFNNTHLALTGFTFKTVVPKGVGFESFGMSWLTTAEIIGNIYENPELLVKKEE